MSILVWGPWVVIALAAWFYGRALLIGLAAARDEQHRLTLKDPWFYFDGEFAPRARKLAIGVLVPLIADFGFLQLVYAYEEIHDGWPRVAIIHTAFHVIADFLWFAAIAGAIGACLVSLAPRLKGPWALWLLGCLPGLLLMLSWRFVIAPRFFSKPWPCWVLANASVACLAFAAFKQAWIRARLRLDRAWFRFAE